MLDFISALVDHPNFRLSDFREFINVAIESLIRAERETQTSDTYVELLHVLDLLVKQLGRDVCISNDCVAFIHPSI